MIRRGAVGWSRPTALLPAEAEREAGGAVAELVLVLGLLLGLVMGLVQVTLVAHVRNVVTADAAEGARYEAAAGRALGSGGQHAQALLGDALADDVRRRLSCTSTRAQPKGAGPLPPVVTVRCAGDVPLTLLPITLHLETVGHALLEAP